MARIYEYGTHNGIKYNKKRTLIRLCIICNQYFEVIGSSQSRRKTCGNQQCDYERRNNHNKNRIKEQHAADERTRYQHLPIEQRKTGNRQRSNHKRRDNFSDELAEIRRMKEQLGL